MKQKIAFTLFVIGVLFILVSFNTPSITSYIVNSNVDIAVNQVPNYLSYEFLSTPFEKGNIFSVYNLKTNPDDIVDIKYFREGDNSELTIINMPGSVKYFSLLEKAIPVSEKIDPFLLNKEYLEEEGYLKKGRVPVIITFKSSPSTSFVSVKSSFITEIDKFLDLSYYNIRSLDFVNAVLMDISLDDVEKIAELQVVERIDLDREVEAILDVSRPLINTENVWKLLDSEGRNVTGKGVSIAIIDTGVDYTHPDLGECFGPACKVVDGYDFVNGDADPMDDHGHGTHVASIAAGIHTGKFRGIAPDAKIYAYKVLNSEGSGTWSQVINGIKRASDPNNDGNTSDHVDVIFMSLGGFGDEDSPIAKAVNEAVDIGVVVVSAAGNSGTVSGAIGVPAAAEKGIAVAATDDNDKLAYFSSRGPTLKNNLKPDLAAPGVDICAAQWDSWLNDRSCGDQHIAISGTSMATPHVAGAAALLLQLHPDWNPDKIKSVLMSTSKDLGLKPWEQGTGRINILEAAKAKILTNISSISFGLVLEKNEFSKNIEIENIADKKLDLTLSVNSFDQNGNVYNISSIDKNSVTLSAGEKDIIKLTIKPNPEDEGRFYGYIKINDGERDYKIPYFFVRLTGLQVEVVNGTEKLSPYTIALRNDDLTKKEYASRYWDFQGNSYTFSIKSGNYTVYAIGDAKDRNTHYILSKPVSLNIGAGLKKVKLDLAKARKFDISTKGIDGRDLDLNEFSFLIKESLDYKIFRLGLIFLRLGSGKNKSIFISDTLDDGIKKEFSISYIGYPHRENDQLKSSYEWRSETYNTIDSLYMIYWILNNITSDSNTQLSFTENELAEYNYIHNLPGGDPNRGSSYFGNAYTLLDFWINPLSSFAAALWEHPAIPLVRKVYIKEGNFAYQHYPHINYLRFNKSIEEFAAAAGQYEYDIRTQKKWPPGVIVKVEEKRNLDHGTNPLIPTHFENFENTIRLNKFLIKGKNKETYLYKSKYVNYWSSSENQGSITLPTPNIKIYENGEKIMDSKLDWDASYIMSRIANNPSYKVEIDIPTGYEIQKNNKIIANFKLEGNDVNPPYLDDLIISPRFENTLDVNFVIKDEKVSNNNLEVKSYYSEGGNWKEINLKRKGNLYSGSINPKEDYVDLRITASDGINDIEYMMQPISKKAKEIDLGFKSNKISANTGDTIFFDGEIKDGNYSITQSYIKYLLNGEIFNFGRSGYRKYNAGKFNVIWNISSNYTQNLVEFIASYIGSGIYKPKEEKIIINVNVPGPKLINFSIYPLNPVTNNDIIIKSVWQDAKKVIFKSNFSGEWKDYQTKKNGNEYSYTIKSNKLSEGIVSWNFEAEDSSGRITKMKVRTFRVRKHSTNITNVNLISFDDNKGWGEKWKFICEVQDPEGDNLRVSLLIKNENDWIIKETKTISDTLDPQNVTFKTELDPSLIGQPEIKCQSDDGGIINETASQKINVEKDDVSLELVDGKNRKVNREGNDKVILSFRVYDADRSIYLNEKLNNSKVVITNDGSKPYDIDKKCEIKNKLCSIELNPDDSFSVGNQTFEGFISDSAYRISSSESSKFVVLGSFSADTKISKEKVVLGKPVEIKTVIKDDTNNKINVDKITIEYREIFSAGQWKICSPVENPEGGTYKCSIDTKKLLPGKYNIKITAEKINYNKFEQIDKVKFKIRKTKFESYKINKTVGKRSKFKIPDLNISLDFLFKEDIENQEINFTFDSENLVAKNFTGLSPLGKYLRIEPPENFNDNLTAVELRIYYTDEEVQEKNFDENSLRISFYNNVTDEWEVFDPPLGGVNTSGNYVWANISHLSDFGVGGKLEDGSICTSNSDCSSNNCAADYDGSGSWCAPSGNCASNGFVNYPTGSTTCYNSNQETCSSGTWSETVCSEGCSSGQCIVSQPEQPPSPPTSPSTPGGIGGGGGGGSRISTQSSEIITEAPECETSDFVCTNWSVCSNNKQTRNCYIKPGTYCKEDSKPEEIKECKEQPLEKVESKNIEEPSLPIELPVEIIQSEKTAENIVFLIAGAFLIIIAVLILLAWRE